MISNARRTNRHVIFEFVVFFILLIFFAPLNTAHSSSPPANKQAQQQAMMARAQSQQQRQTLFSAGSQGGGVYAPVLASPMMARVGLFFSFNDVHIVFHLFFLIGFVIDGLHAQSRELFFDPVLAPEKKLGSNLEHFRRR